MIRVGWNSEWEPQERLFGRRNQPGSKRHRGATSALDCCGCVRAGIQMYNVQLVSHLILVFGSRSENEMNDFKDKFQIWGLNDSMYSNLSDNFYH